MASSKVGIVNIALSHLSIGKTVAVLETEKSEEAVTARLFYDLALEATLREFPWPFTTRIIALALVEEEPNDEWAFSYRYPADCLKIRRILSGMRNDTRQSRTPYRILSDEQGSLVYTDYENVQIEYTVRDISPQFYPPDFVMAFSLYMAHLMAPRLTGGDQFKLGARALGLYDLEISRAVKNAFNEQQIEEPPESEFIRDRE